MDECETGVKGGQRPLPKIITHDSFAQQFHSTVTPCHARSFPPWRSPLDLPPVHGIIRPSCHARPVTVTLLRSSGRLCASRLGGENSHRPVHVPRLSLSSQRPTLDQRESSRQPWQTLAANVSRPSVVAPRNQRASLQPPPPSSRRASIESRPSYRGRPSGVFPA